MRTELRIRGSSGKLKINALADTGASINAISLSEMQRPGLAFEPDVRAARKIRLPDGTTRSALGSTLLRFVFDGERKTQVVRCIVLRTLRPGIILGRGFLKSSGTLAKDLFVKRVKRVITTAKCVPRMCLLDDNDYDDGLIKDNHEARLHGFVSGQYITAVPDSGSGIMAMSMDCAVRLGLQADTNRRTKVMFADGTITLTLSTVIAAWSFR